jgi:hypothetical protein
VSGERAQSTSTASTSEASHTQKTSNDANKTERERTRHDASDKKTRGFLYRKRAMQRIIKFTSEKDLEAAVRDTGDAVAADSSNFMHWWVRAVAFWMLAKCHTDVTCQYVRLSRALFYANEAMALITAEFEWMKTYIEVMIIEGTEWSKTLKHKIKKRNTSTVSAGKASQVSKSKSFVKHDVTKEKWYAERWVQSIKNCIDNSHDAERDPSKSETSDKDKATTGESSALSGLEETHEANDDEREEEEDEEEEEASGAWAHDMSVEYLDEDEDEDEESEDEEGNTTSYSRRRRPLIRFEAFIDEDQEENTTSDDEDINTSSGEEMNMSDEEFHTDTHLSEINDSSEDGEDDDEEEEEIGGRRHYSMDFSLVTKSAKDFAKSAPVVRTNRMYKGHCNSEVSSQFLSLEHTLILSLFRRLKMSIFMALEMNM